ncbi:hypothetical protein CYMTET_55787 [Cymbomonas tetramitiformis]|uniref:sn-1-specific diacylglycerol lipase n=1 Tax=Cymbomonas tetramitiformis TaxID=36881 RepID=A0AAE0BCM0_9CHLO|nr:hypothetical protein CYMTET_55787 [Cymbomonas tetramitiformis]|eukprot:gene23257-28148_t
MAEDKWATVKQAVNQTVKDTVDGAVTNFPSMVKKLKEAAHEEHLKSLVHEAMKSETFKTYVKSAVTLKGGVEDEEEDEETVGMFLVVMMTMFFTMFAMTCWSCRSLLSSKKVTQKSASGSTIYDEDNWYLRAKAVAGMVNEASKVAVAHLQDTPTVPYHRLGLMVYGLGSIRTETLEKKPEVLQREADQYGCLPLEKGRMEELNEFVPFAVMAYDDEDTVRGKLEPKGYELVQFEPDAIVEMPSHFMAYNKHTKTILVAIKGTTTVEDCVTDVLCKAIDFQGGKAHSGMLKAATFVVGRMAPLLEDIFIPLGYRIVVTGHSLGAGTACLTTLLFKKRGLTNVKCYAYATPPCLTKELALGSRGMITSVTHCDDIVTRASLRNVKALMVAVGSIHEKNRRVSVTQLTQKLNTDETQELLLKSSAEVELGQEDLFVPGTVVHFHKYHGKYVGHITDGAYHALRRLELSATCVTDHLTTGYEECCKSENQLIMSDKQDYPRAEDDDSEKPAGWFY